MGLHKVLHQLSWPAILSSAAHVLSSTSLVVINKVILYHLAFHFPITLAFIQQASVALCLWFWSIFGLFKVRVLPWPTTLRLCIGAAVCSMLNILSLHHNSLLTYQAVRMASPPLVLLLYRFNAHRYSPAPPRLEPHTIVLASICACVGAAALAFVDPHRTSLGLLCAVCSLVAAALYHNLSAPLRAATRANELQLQLVVKSCATLFMAPFVPMLDNYSRTSPDSIFSFAFDEGATILVLSTGLLAFFSFVAMRASIHRLHSQAYNHLVYLVSLGILAAYFVVFENQVSTVHFLAISLLMLGTVLLSAVNADEAERADVLRRRLLEEEAGLSEMDLYSDEDMRGEEWERERAPWLSMSMSDPIASYGRRRELYDHTALVSERRPSLFPE